MVRLLPWQFYPTFDLQFEIFLYSILALKTPFSNKTFSLIMIVHLYICPYTQRYVNELIPPTVNFVWAPGAWWLQMHNLPAKANIFTWLFYGFFTIRGTDCVLLAYKVNSPYFNVLIISVVGIVLYSTYKICSRKYKTPNSRLLILHITWFFINRIVGMYVLIICRYTCPCSFRWAYFLSCAEWNQIYPVSVCYLYSWLWIVLTK